MGDFRVVIIDAKGKERLNQATNRETSRFVHHYPNPIAAGFLLDTAHDRVIFRIADPDVNRQAEEWWPYQISDGKPLQTFRPKSLMANTRAVRSIIDAKPVAGTPLTLIHWWCFDFDRGGVKGARFTLIGHDGKPVWSRDLPDDYEVSKNEDAEAQLRESIWANGALLRTDQSGQFELRFVKDAQRVTFKVGHAAAGAWTVSETERHPFVEPNPRPVEPKSTEIPVRSLRLVGRIDLRAPSDGPTPSIDDVDRFVFDDKGRIAFIRHVRGKSPALVLADQQGKILQTVSLDPARAENGRGWTDVASVGHDRFVLLRDTPADKLKMEAWWVDVATKKASPIKGLSSTAMSRIAGFPDECFVIKGGLTYFRAGATSDNGLYAFDARGKSLWTLPGHGDPNDPAALFAPEAVTVTTDGVIAAIDVIRKMVQFFDRTGKHRRTVDLKKSWGREPTYPSGLSADRNGGVVIHDFQAETPIVRMNADGSVRSEVRPRLADGQRFELRDAQVAPDGVLWVTDGHALFRLTAAGVVDRVLGRAPDPRDFKEAASVALDVKGQIYAVAGRTGAVHVFAPNGRWLRVCVPKPGEIARELALPHVTVSDAGDVYVSLGVAGNGRYLHYSGGGKPVGVESVGLDDIREEWYCQPTTGQRWVLGYEKVFLIDASRKVLRTIARRADGRWIKSPEHASVAPDGSIAVLSMENDAASENSHAVSLFSPRGEPLRTFILPDSVASSVTRVAYDGKRVAIAVDKQIVLFDLSGQPLWRFTPPQENDEFWTPFLSPAGQELWLFNGRHTIDRYGLP
jgi:hypothetical protein